MVSSIRNRGGVAALCTSVSLLLVASAPAGAAPKRITGKLSKPGYTVIALAANGRATAVRVTRRRFKLRPPARRVTLHLRAKDGTYAGPIVIGRKKKGRRAVLGVGAGARLGRIAVLRGYAKLSKRLPGKWVDTRRVARAKSGVPIGARRFGLVRSRHARGPRGDRDLDGIPNPLDIDDDGDRTLDNLDRSTNARRATTSQEEGPQLHIASSLPLGLTATTNANALNLGLGWVDLNFSQMARLGIEILPGDQAELDCGGRPHPTNPDGWIGGLGYCARGGTGGHFVVPDPTPLSPFDWPPFPESYDPDQDGFGTLQPGSGGGMFLVEATTTDKVRSGDVLIERVTNNGVETAYPATLQYVFNTIPALASYQDGTMSSPRVIPYPVEFGQPGTRPDNGLPVSDGAEDADSDVELTLTFWRPQRQRIPGDPGQGEWIDIGGLTYTLQGFFAGGQFCGPQGAYSTADPNLIPAPPEILGTDQKGLPGGGFTDLAADQPANPGNKLTFTVNLTQCLHAQGVSLNPGDWLGLQLTAISAAPNFVHDTAEQGFLVKRQ